MLDKQCIELAKITRYEYKEILSLKNVWNNKEIKLHSPSITDEDINKIRNDKRFKWEKVNNENI